MVWHRLVALLHHSDPKNKEFPFSSAIFVCQTQSRKERITPPQPSHCSGRRQKTMMKNTQICVRESELRGLSLPVSLSSSFALRKIWQRSTNSHHALHFSLSTVQCQVFRRLLFLLAMIKTVSQSQIRSCFCSPGLFVPKRLPVPNSLLSFIRERNAGK